MTLPEIEDIMPNPYEIEYLDVCTDFDERMQNGAALILCYHGVSSGGYQDDAPGAAIRNRGEKHLPLDVFRSQVEYLVNNNYNIISVQAIDQMLKDGVTPPPYTVAFTFDDGFENNLLAADVLKEHNLPATFYICPGMVEQGVPFWVDVLEDIFARTTLESIDVEIGVAKNYRLTNNDERYTALSEIKNYAKKIGSSERAKLLRELQAKTGIIPTTDSHPNYKLMNWEQIRQLDNDPLFTDGGHSWNHAMMGTLSEEELQTDITNTVSTLSRELGHRVTDFAYPEGFDPAKHFNDDVIKALQESGIEMCPIARPGLNDRSVVGLPADSFHLQRVMTMYGIFPPTDERIK
jgi:peptidoglycan/xylan/chitin deacetylase (PgdA/CDA1 family)